MIKKWYLRLHESVWFIPGSYSFFALILSIIALSVDTIYANNIHKWLPSYLLTDVELAQTILSALAPSLLTMTTITFSMIMVVLTTYTSQFSPRTLQNFITERRTLRVLGIFIGGFIYTILALLFMRKNEEEQVVFSAVLGVAISILCLGYFVYFIHHVATSLRVSKLIENLSTDILETVHKLHKGNKDKNNVDYTPPSAQMLDVLTNKPIEVPPLNNVGYIQLIDLEGLRNEAQQCNAVIKVNYPIGAYVGPATSLLLIWPQSKKIENTHRFLDYITVGESRTTFQDMEYGIQKLTEIALRAVSPGINDPNTAITCIKSYGNILH
ncbi:DUF2254 domain-containing protein [Bacillus taeanensis]|uniref:DUF2254 domain-containing protein n=1 Tax=Bacillus taeanensis TaxID=273032 RepID=A0A366XU53_9BACI|nr:DUF2254 domain-containing protein [Bacillus taeanensis]